MKSKTDKIPSVRIPLWVKLAVFAGTLAVLSTVGLGLALTGISARTIKASSRDYRLALAEDVAGTVRISLGQARLEVQAAAEILTRGHEEPGGTVNWLLSVVTASSVIDHVVVYDADGERIDAVAEAGVDAGGPQQLSEAALARLREDRETVVGLIEPGTPPRIQIMASVRPTDGAPTGFVVTRARLDHVTDRVQQLGAERLASAGSRLFVTDVDRNIIASAGPGESVQRHPLLEGADLLMSKRVAQSGEISSARGDLVASVLPLPELKWFVVVEVPRDVAYASLTQMRVGIWIAVVVALLLALLASAVGARRIADPLRQLASFAERLAKRDFEARVEVESGDEVGVLAAVMNGAAAQLAASEEQIRIETEIRADLRRYLPHELVDAVVRREQNLELGGMRAPITVLFADIVRFTPLCESLQPEQVVTLLNEFFTIATEIVFRHGGTIDKFVGDSVMAFWGAPKPCDDHADRALRAAEDILRWLEIGNEAWREQFGLELEVAIGVNTGTPIVGNVGSSTRMEYTIIGETVNTAARLEALARPGQILTAAATKAASTEYEFARVGEELIHADGRQIEIWEALV